MPVTSKTVQVHFECACGYNEVYQDTFSIPWRQLSAYGIKRKVDKATGERWLFNYVKQDICKCYELD